VNRDYFRETLNGRFRPEAAAINTNMPLLPGDPTLTDQSPV